MLALGRLGGLTNRLTGQRCDFVELGCQILVDCQRLRVTCRRLLRPHACAECEPVRDANREFVRLFAPNPCGFRGCMPHTKTPSVISACTLCRARYATFDRIPHLTVKIQLTFALSASNTPGTQRYAPRLRL